MSHMRYWGMTLAIALSGAFIAVERFTFAPSTAVWIAFAVAIAGAVFALGATGVALVRENQVFSGLSTMSALFAAWTIIVTRTFAAPTALWLAFAGGLAMLLVSLRALALHETTIERVVHALEVGTADDGTALNGAGGAIAATQPATVGTTTVRSTRGRVQISDETRSWVHWLTHTALALAGAFVVLSTFVWPVAGQPVSSRWLVFAVGIAATAIALVSLVERVLPRRADSLNESGSVARAAGILLTAASAAVSAGLIVLMAVLNGSDARWWAFGLGAGIVGVSLVALVIHELTSERVRHELEIAHLTTARTEQEPAIESAH